MGDKHKASASTSRQAGGVNKSMDEDWGGGVVWDMPASHAKPCLYVLTGCTAVGKTELALTWAEQNDAEIISCDSLLFYKGMDIGTAKPAKTELARVPHHLVDLCEPREQMDISRYVSLALAVAAEIREKGRKVLVTGGSGFYLKAFFSPVVDDVQVPETERERIRALEPAAALAELRALNPGGLGRLDVANPRRVTRALERCVVSGKTLEQLAADFAAKPCPFEGWERRLVRLEREPEDLDRRIRARVGQMLASGLVSEVRSLLERGILDNPSAASAIGYREPLAFLRGEISEQNLHEEIVKNTRGLVRKQRTWFRTQLPVHETRHPEQLDAATLFH